MWKELRYLCRGDALIFLTFRSFKTHSAITPDISWFMFQFILSWFCHLKETGFFVPSNAIKTTAKHQTIQWQMYEWSMVPLLLILVFNFCYKITHANSHLERFHRHCDDYVCLLTKLPQNEKKWSISNGVLSNCKSCIPSNFRGCIS